MMLLAPSLPRVSFTVCDGKALTKARASNSHADGLGKMREKGTDWKSLEEFRMSGMHLLIG